MHFEILGRIENPQTIATGKAIRELPRLIKVYGKGRWRKMKGLARIRFFHGRMGSAELHWYEAHGIGRKETKLKRFADEL